MKTLYVVVNDNFFDSVEDRVEYAFKARVKAEKYCNERNGDMSDLHSYWIETINLNTK